MQSIRTFSILIVLSLMIFSCKEKEDSLINKNIEDLIFITITKNSFPLPPPPEFVGDSIVNSPKNTKVMDSLKKIDLNIALYPVVESFILTKKKVSIDDDIDSHELLQKLHQVPLNKRINVNSIDKNSHHHIVYADSIILNKSKDWRGYDLLFTFSEITLSSNYNFAKVTTGISRSALWGQAFDFYFEKNKIGEWEIVNKIYKEKW